MWLKVTLCAVFLISSNSQSVNAISAKCANSTLSCSPDQTCCQVRGASALCCPYSDGVCCDDGRFCCPKNSVCFPEGGFCLAKRRYGIPSTEDVQSPVPLQFHGLESKPKREVCPSKKMICPSKSTCCPGPYIGYDCCPTVHGVCCGNFRHCCPANFTCDIEGRQCINGSYTLPWFRKLKAEVKDLTHLKYVKVKIVRKKPIGHHVANLTCPDNKTKCGHLDTCCSNGTGYGCCGAHDAVCCLGGTYCCPKNTTCDPYTNTCTRKGQHNRTLAIKIPRNSAVYSKDSAAAVTEMLPVVNLTKSPKRWLTYDNRRAIDLTTCLAQNYSCPKYMSCCVDGGSRHGCCPFSNGICCKDKWHCCPSGAVCDLDKMRCVRGGIFTPLFLRGKANIVTHSKRANRWCPDHKSECPDQDTCCQLPSSQYGCCPLPNAVCCTDHIHCCPHGTVCDVAAGQCKSGNDVSFQSYTNVTEKTTTKERKAPTVCPGGQFECSATSTCCNLAGGGWGCCPFQNGICCNDGGHCCPSDYFCDTVQGRCVRRNSTSNAFP